MSARERRTLVSVIMPVYEHERFVAEALRSVLVQTYRPLEIIVIDDCSTDRTFEIAGAEIASYRGPHRIVLDRNERNLGIEIYNVLMEKAGGEFIVQAHGDDISVPSRVAKLVARWQQTNVSLVSSNVLQVDEARRPMNLWFKAGSALDCSAEGLIGKRWHGPCVGAALAYEREVIEAFGRFGRSRSSICTDGILPFRAALLKGISILNQPLVRFRRHPSAASQRKREGYPFLEAWEAEVMIRIVGDLHTVACLKRRRPDDARLDALRARLLREMLKHAAIWSRMRTAMRSHGWRCEWTRRGVEREDADEAPPRAGDFPPAPVS